MSTSYARHGKKLRCSISGFDVELNGALDASFKCRDCGACERNRSAGSQKSKLGTDETVLRYIVKE